MLLESAAVDRELTQQKLPFALTKRNFRCSALIPCVFAPASERAVISGWLWGSGGFETLQTRVGRINAMGRFWVGMVWCWMGDCVSVVVGPVHYTGRQTLVLCVVVMGSVESVCVLCRGKEMLF